MSLSQHVGESTPLFPREVDDNGFTIKMKSTSTREMFWEELQTLLQYAWPLLRAQWLEHSISAINLISIGHLSTTALAALSLGTMTANVTGISVLQGFASGLDTILPAAFTSHQPELVGLWTQRMGVVMVCVLVPIFIVWHSSEVIFVALGQDLEVARMAALYLRWLSLGLPALTFNIISRRYFESQQLLSIQAKIIFYVAPINCLINYILVLGPQHVRLGFIGAPIATVISYYLIALALFIYGRYLAPKTAWHPLSGKIFHDLCILIHLGMSGVAQLASAWWAWECVALATSFLGPTAFVCQSILLSALGITFQIFFSNASAVMIRVGNLIGRKDVKRASTASSVGMIVALLAAAITSSGLYLTRHDWPKLYTDDPAIATLVLSVTPVIVLHQFSTAFSQVGMGHLRLQGNQLIAAMMNISGYFILGLPLGLWLAFSYDFGLAGLWIGITTGLTLQSVGVVILWFKIDWSKEVLKAAERNSREDRNRKAARLTEEED